MKQFITKSMLVSVVFCWNPFEEYFLSYSNEPWSSQRRKERKTDANRDRNVNHLMFAQPQPLYLYNFFLLNYANIVVIRDSLPFTNTSVLDSKSMESNSFDVAKSCGKHLHFCLNDCGRNNTHSIYRYYTYYYLY